MTRRRWLLAAAMILFMAAFIIWGVWWAECGAPNWQNYMEDVATHGPTHY